MSASGDAGAGGALSTATRWQHVVVLARLLRDQLRRYREVAPAAGVGAGQVPMDGEWRPAMIFEDFDVAEYFGNGL